MKKSFWSVLYSVMAISMFLPQVIFAGSVLQISAEPGVSVWLNRELIGKTTKEQNGLIVGDLAPGEYMLKASMPGYDAVEALLSVENNQTIEWRIGLARPSMKVEDSVTRIESSMVRSEPTGTVILKSIPLNAEIFFDGESIGATDKKLTYVPAAGHEVKFVFQKKEMAKKFSLQPDESLLLKADFTAGELVAESAEIDSSRGQALIKMQTARKRKPALFPHRMHQAMFECANCHHGADNEGKQVPYADGMEIQHCVTCHNQNMENRQLSSLMLAAHTRCKGCHRKIVAESGTAGPIDKCVGCHNVPDEK